MAVRQQSGDSDTAAQILDVAERLVQTRGYNAFSYADVAAELGITKAALHYHYAGKAELGEALLARYTSRFAQALADIDSTGADALHKLEAYTQLYARVLAQDRMCLCGMLAADFNTLPDPMRRSVISFFDHNEAWLSAVLDQGQREGTHTVTGTSRDTAQTIIGTLEGAMLVARTYRDPERFAAATRRLLAELHRRAQPDPRRSGTRRAR